MAEKVSFVCLWTTQVLSSTADLFHQMGMRCLLSWYPSPCENQIAYQIVTGVVKYFNCFFYMLKEDFMDCLFFAD